MLSLTQIQACFLCMGFCNFSFLEWLNAWSKVHSKHPRWAASRGEAIYNRGGDDKGNERGSCVWKKKRKWSCVKTFQGTTQTLQQTATAIQGKLKIASWNISAGKADHWKQLHFQHHNMTLHTLHLTWGILKRQIYFSHLCIDVIALTDRNLGGQLLWQHQRAYGGLHYFRYGCCCKAALSSATWPLCASARPNSTKDLYHQPHLCEMFILLWTIEQ